MKNEICGKNVDNFYLMKSYMTDELCKYEKFLENDMNMSVIIYTA